MPTNQPHRFNRALLQGVTSRALKLAARRFWGQADDTGTERPLLDQLPDCGYYFLLGEVGTGAVEPAPLIWVSRSEEH